MRAMRMMDMLCKGWIEKSGGSSSKAGLNGGPHPKRTQRTMGATHFCARAQAWTTFADASSTMTVRRALAPQAHTAHDGSHSLLRATTLTLPFSTQK
jgi:hypothetical protein